MKILGLNGLGITPSACLIIDGQLIAFAEEERFTRLKGSTGMMPAQAVRYCMQEGKVNLAEIDFIGFGWNCNLYKTSMPLFYLKKLFTRTGKKQGTNNILRVVESLLKYHPGNVEKAIKQMFRSIGMYEPIPAIKYFSNHLAHAASACYIAGFENCYTLVLDGSGDKVSTSIYKYSSGEVTLVEAIEMPDSLGWFYQSITEFLGFLPNHHEGKTMALAATGHHNPDVKENLQRILEIKKNGTYRFNPEYSYSGSHEKGVVFSEEMVSLLGEPRYAGHEIQPYHRDIAFHAQQLLEEACMKLVDTIASKSDFNGNICIAGGVGLNCKMNGIVAQHPSVKNLYVPPHSGETGSALGAALALTHIVGDHATNQMNHAYWGPSYSNEEIEHVLKSAKLSYRRSQNIAKETASLLANDKMIAWFQGRMEVGARALGNRSILANPANLKNKEYINDQIKKRELWRPFAASIAIEYEGEYLHHAKEASFMTIAYMATDKFAQEAPAAIHIDRTTRPQIVSEITNPRYWQLIHEFGKLTGLYAVLNTSFNLQEEPIVCTPAQAIKVYCASPLDALVIGDFILEK